MNTKLTLLARSFTLSCLFFYPLIASIEESAYFLHWTPTNSVELLIAVAIMTGLYFGLLTLGEKKPGRVSFIILAFFLGITFSFFAIHFSRQIIDIEKIEGFGKSIFFKIGIVLILGSLVYPLILKADNKYRDKFMKVLGGVLTVTFFVAVLSFWVVIKGLFPKEEAKVEEPVVTAAPFNQNVLILLFDEMSYQFLYKDKKIHPLFPNYAKVSEQATNYHLAYSYGKATLTAIPPMLIGKPYYGLVAKGIDGKLAFKHGEEWKFYDQQYPDVFRRARARGMSTHAVGKYHPYCAIFPGMDTCDSSSTYNTSGVTKSFNVFHAFLTNFNILPSKMPFGLFKNPVASYNHKNTFEKEFKLAEQIIHSKQPFFAFIHFNSPHAPFVFDKNGFKLSLNPYNQNEENYMKQMEFLDIKLGELLDMLHKQGIYDNTNLIIMSDHNYRKITPENEHDRIPLMVKKAGQNSRQDVEEKTMSGEIVSCIFPDDPNCDRI